MLNLFGDNSEDDNYKPSISEEELSDEDVLIELIKIKEELKDKVVVLGHHYQQDDIIRFADITGDSLQLAKEAVKLDKEYIIFVAFILWPKQQTCLQKPTKK
jgi:quinolinate synthase